jgi:hypothetical protein
LTSIRWTDQAVLAATCLAEASLLWLVARAVISAPADDPGLVSPWLVVALLWGTALLPRALEAFDVWDPWYRLISAGAVALSLGIAIKAISFPDGAWWSTEWLRGASSSLILRESAAKVSVWSVVALVAYSWWRGHTRDEPTLDAAYRLLKLGTIAAMAGACLLAVTDRGNAGNDSAAAVAVFIIAALAAIGMARLATGESGRQAGINARSALVAFAPIVIVLALGIVFTGLVRRDLLDTILWAVAPLFWALAILFRILVLGIALIALIILSPVLWLVQGRSLQLKPIQFDRGNAGREGIIREASDRANATPDLIRYVVAAAALLLIFSGVTRFVLRRRSRLIREGEDEERTRLRPLIDFSGLLASLLHALGLKQPEAAEDPLAAMRGDPRWAGTVAIRERYREFLVWCAHRGHPRGAGSTPVEHGTTLNRTLTGHGARDDIETMIAIYARARYGEEPARPSDAEAMETAWRRLEQAARAER